MEIVISFVQSGFRLLPCESYLSTIYKIGTTIPCKGAHELCKHWHLFHSLVLRIHVSSANILKKNDIAAIGRLVLWQYSAVLIMPTFKGMKAWTWLHWCSDDASLLRFTYLPAVIVSWNAENQAKQTKWNGPSGGLLFAAIISMILT